MFNFLFVVMTMLPVQDNGCYIVCTDIDTVALEDRAFLESDGDIVYRWEPVIVSYETFRIPISCEDAAIIDETRLRVIR